MNRRSRFWATLGTLAVAYGLAMLMLLGWQVGLAHAHDAHWVGPIDELPDEGLEGTWIVGGREFEVTADTEIDADDEEIVIDACVEVEYRSRDATDIAVEIDIEDRRDCLNGDDDDDDADDADDDDDVDDDDVDDDDADDDDADDDERARALRHH